MPSHHDRHCRHIELGRIADADDRPAIVLRPKEAIGRRLHHQEVFRCDRQGSQHAEHELDPVRCLDEAGALQEAQIREVTDIVSLELRSRVVRLHGLSEGLHIAKGIAQDKVFRSLDVRLLPLEAVVFGFEVAGRRMHGEVDRPQVKGSQFRLKERNNPQTFLWRHTHRAPSR